MPSCDHASLIRPTYIPEMCNGKTRRPRRSCCCAAGPFGGVGGGHPVRRVPQSVQPCPPFDTVHPSGWPTIITPGLPGERIPNEAYGQLVPVNWPGGYSFHGPAMFSRQG